jgi:hypothetical protein
MVGSYIIVAKPLLSLLSRTSWANRTYFAAHGEIVVVLDDEKVLPRVVAQSPVWTTINLREAS